MKKAVFLDRDGVINSDKGHYYIYRVKDFVLNFGITEGLQLLVKHGFLLFIITNQGGIAKGLYTLEEVDKIHRHLQKILARSQIYFTEIYCCPHHESISKCPCRKPSPYFILQAEKKYDLDLQKSYFIGNSDKDMQAAQAAGIKGVRVSDNENIVPYCKTIINESTHGNICKL